MIKYKLTSQDMTTYHGTLWQLGEWKETSGKGGLETPGYLHYYHDSLLAIVLNPIHAEIENPRLWEIETDGTHLDDRGLKGGCPRMRLVRELPLPEITPEARVKFAILCALNVFKDQTFVKWANGWLSGKDRSIEAAWTATRAVTRAATVAAWTETEAAWEATWAAARVVTEEKCAAQAADRAARAADIDLIKIAKESLK